MSKELNQIQPLAQDLEACGDVPPYAVESLDLPRIGNFIGASPTPWSIRRVGGVWQVFDADWVMIMSFLDGAANTADVQMIVDSVNNVRAVSAELDAVNKRVRDLTIRIMQADKQMCEVSRERDDAMARSGAKSIAIEKLEGEAELHRATMRQIVFAVFGRDLAEDEYTDVDSICEWIRGLRAENQKILERAVQAEEDARDSEQRMFELCVAATCPFCNYGSSFVGNDKKYHIRPHAECAATYLHVRFLEHSRAMLEKLDGAK